MMTTRIHFTAECDECGTAAEYPTKTAADNLTELHNQIHHTEA